jgi:mannitol/fructose-specific phosphotransferase system IIA component (Ntr-type)
MPVTKIIDYLRDEHCLPDLEGGSREDVIEEIAGLFVESGAITQDERDTLLESVFEREAAATTGVGNGIALPHPQVDDVAFLDHPLIGVGLCADGVDFRALDNAPVHTVFLVASPDRVEYLEVAKRIAALARAGSREEKWRRVIGHSRTPSDLREALQDAWEELAP